MTDTLSTQEIPNLLEQLKTLEMLQELDLRMDRLRSDCNSLPAALKQRDDALGLLKRQTEAKRVAIADVEKAQKQTLAAIDMNEDRLKRSTARLEGVQNTQEYQAITKEIDQLRKFVGTLQEQKERAASQLTALGAELTALEEKTAAQQAERDAEASKIGEQSGKLEGDLSSLTAERKQMTDKVDRRILSKYDRVRGARAGLGFVPVVSGRCKGCNMMVPPQLFNQIVRANALYACPSCHRLLYLPGSQPQVSATASV